MSVDTNPKEYNSLAIVKLRQVESNKSATVLLASGSLWLINVR